ncbi:MAG: HAD family phosphatase [Lachnospiraceae bacterium]|nr:HAD family phosphatase [Lachnospiraceae bacterium]
MMKKIVVFDMGMVLVDFAWRKMLRNLGYEEDQVAMLGQAVYQNKLWSQFDRGSMSDQEIISKMKEESPNCIEGIDKIMKTENFGNAVVPYSYAEDLTRMLHEEGYRVYILSNFGRRLFDIVQERFTFLQYVDGVIISAKYQQMKPEESIYQTLFKTYSVDPQEAVFFDDVEANCQAARALGMETVQVPHDHMFVGITDGLKQYLGLEVPEEMLKKYKDVPRHE